MGLSRGLVVALALTLPGTALAQLEPSRTGRAALGAFNVMDRDGDGGLTLAELRVRGREKDANALFALLDADGDGRLSVKELGHGGLALSRFDAYDVNKDGFVTAREFPNYVDPVLVQALDANGDGRVALAELRPAFAGSRAVKAIPVESAKPHRRPQPPKPAAYCWIPGFGDDQWEIEAPVLWTTCRTSPG